MKPTFSSRLASLMKRAGFSVTSLVKSSGLPRQRIHEYLSGTMPRGDVVAKLAKALGCTTDALLVEEVTPSSRAQV